MDINKERPKLEIGDFVNFIEIIQLFHERHNGDWEMVKKAMSTPSPFLDGCAPLGFIHIYRGEGIQGLLGMEIRSSQSR